MHNNYYFLRQLTKYLQDSLVGLSVGEVYSQQKNELTIALCKGEGSVYINAHLSPEYCGLSFPENHSRARRNSADLFKPVYGREIEDVVQIENDRSFYIRLKGGFRLLFKMHGSRSNIILLKGGEILEIFRNGLKKDFEIDINNLSKKIDTSFENFANHNGDYKSVCPTFGKAFDAYFEGRQFVSLPIERQYSCFTELLTYLERPKFYIHIQDDKLPVLSLFQISENDLVFSSPVLALNALFKAFVSDYQLEKEKSKLQNSLLGQLKKGEAYIKKSQEKLNSLHTATGYTNIGDLIMANLNLIRPNQKEVVFDDFYTQKPVEIKLNPLLSPQLNAEKYYKKARKQRVEIETLEKNIAIKRRETKEIQNQIDQIRDIKSLREFRKSKEIHTQEAEAPFHKVLFMNYEIFIGKNARTNEMLTFQVAGKDDLFLHAKDTPGSHVIIRKKSNQNFPASVIERAASYAAYYSKAKGESLIRVLYTAKKYVRKAKGLAPGAVIVVNEKILLVKPEEIRK